MNTALQYRFVATCGAGLEELLFAELAEFRNIDAEMFSGGVSWYGDLESGYRACLWSRFASRVFLEICSFVVHDSDDVYEAATRVRWTDHLDEKMSFAVSASFGTQPSLSHSHFAALRVKDALVDFFRSQGFTRPNVAKEHPDVHIHLYHQENLATLSIDLSGESLHRRGYRASTGIAPLKENLAAALVALTGWSKKATSADTLIDPMCGSATLLIEAALLWSDSAPGLSRKYFGFKRWLGHDGPLFSRLVDEAIAREEASFVQKWPRFIGYDADPQMVSFARENIKNAGLEERISIKCQELAHLQSPSGQGFLLSNLPYGERLADKSQIKFLYSGFGKILRDSFSGWQVGVFLNEPDLSDTLGLEVEKSHRLFNGPLACRLIVGHVRKKTVTPATLRMDANAQVEDGQDFTNRLKKNVKRLQPWARKNGISCFRVYDRDLPEYNVTVDVYDRWILIQEYRAPASVAMDLAEHRFSTAIQNIRTLFGVKREQVFIKRRQRQRGKSQYQKKEGKMRYHQVREGKCCFLVNFTSYLDTGLFLDHRPIRQKIADAVWGKRFLNLYGYTGAATVHAAMGGASLTTTVDVSATYLSWAKNNLALNGFSTLRHELVQEDCLLWLKEKISQYDVIFIDPPTFSNSKKKKRVFDVQRDHFELLRLAALLLADDGVVFFSTNFKGFRLDDRVGELLAVQETTKETIPLDFQRNRKVHRSWQLSKK